MIIMIVQLLVYSMVMTYNMWPVTSNMIQPLDVHVQPVDLLKVAFSVINNLVESTQALKFNGLCNGLVCIA